MGYSPGKGALVQHGKIFWFPVRLLQREEMPEGAFWRVRFWRGCVYDDEDGAPDPTALIPEERIVDELENDRSRRRQIRVSVTEVLKGFYSTRSPYFIAGLLEDGLLSS